MSLRKWRRLTYALGLTLSVTIALTLSGCYSQREIELTGFILAVGLDRGEEKSVKLVAEMAVPAAIAGEGDGGKGSEKPVILLTAEGNTISEAIQELSMISPNRLFWGHADVVVMTTDLLQGGLRRVSDILLREREFRPGARIYATDEELDELFAVEFATQPGNANYIEGLTERRATNSMSPQLMVMDLGSAGESSASALLVPVLKLDRTSIASDQEGGGKALRLEGSKVIDDTGLVGELTGTETRGALWVLGEVGETLISLSSPGVGEAPMGIRVLRSWSEVDIKVDQDRVEDSVVTVLVRGEADLTEVQDLDPYQTVGDLSRINSALNEAVRLEIRRTLNKARDMEADVFGFGERFRRSMSARKWRDLQSRWRSVFPKLEVVVDVDIRLRRRGMTT